VLILSRTSWSLRLLSLKPGVSMIEDELLDVLRNLGLALDVLHLNSAF
jgi:hypothetical protein